MKIVRPVTNYLDNRWKIGSRLGASESAVRSSGTEVSKGEEEGRRARLEERVGKESLAGLRWGTRSSLRQRYLGMGRATTNEQRFLAVVATGGRNPEYEDTDDEWPGDRCREIGPLNDVTFLIQRIHEGTIERRDDETCALPPLFLTPYFFLSLLRHSISRSIFLPVYVHVYIGAIYRRNRSVSCRWYPDNILATAAAERDKERKNREGRRGGGSSSSSKSKLASVSVTLHPPRTNNVQLDTLQPAPTSGSPSNGARDLPHLFVVPLPS